jgi:hypothetical protein
MSPGRVNTRTDRFLRIGILMGVQLHCYAVVYAVAPRTPITLALRKERGISFW